MPRNDGLICGFTATQCEVVVRHYRLQPLLADYCPYMPEGEALYSACRKDGIDIDRATFFRRLIALRKKEVLPPKERRRCDLPFTRGQEGYLAWLYECQDTPRDRLMYTADFDKLAIQFRFGTGRNWSDCEIFHGLMHLGKSGRLGRKGRGGDGGKGTPPARPVRPQPSLPGFGMVP